MSEKHANPPEWIPCYCHAPIPFDKIKNLVTKKQVKTALAGRLGTFLYRGAEIEQLIDGLFLEEE